jgi:DNA-binding response OmpR family regulator
VVNLYLRRAGYGVTLVADGRAALDSLAQSIPDLVVLDLMLPKVDGLAVTRWLRDRSDVPIIMLTARRDESDRIAGLEMGADDYVVKPFSPQELVSRVRAVLRRAHPSEELLGDQPVAFPGLRIDPQTRLVVARDQEISLTAKEFDMLYLLARHPRQVFSRDQLLERVWGLSEYIDPSTVTVHVRRLREKIEADPSRPERILTVWGVGYKFEP